MGHFNSGSSLAVGKSSPNKIAPVKNRPALPWRETGALGRCEGVAAQAVRFAILTAARSGEIRGASWGEVDLADKL